MAKYSLEEGKKRILELLEKTDGILQPNEIGKLIGESDRRMVTLMKKLRDEELVDIYVKSSDLKVKQYTIKGKYEGDIYDPARSY